jgi:hypothetical protein
VETQANQVQRLRCEIIGIQQPDGDPTLWYAIETFRVAGETRVLVTAFAGEPTPEEKARPARAIASDTLVLAFAAVRGLATGFLRAYYHEVPASTSRLPTDDPVEHLTHLEEVLRLAVHDPQITDIGNAIQLEKERNDALREVGKGRRHAAFWEAEYRKASKWRKQNAARVAALRREVRTLNVKVKEIPFLVEGCENWHRVYPTRGANCYNCAYREGWPQRSQPDEGCKNFKVLIFGVKKDERPMADGGQ